MHHYHWLLVLCPRPYFRASGQLTTYAPPSDQWSYCLNTSRRIEAATRLNRRFSKSCLMLCSSRIKGSRLLGMLDMSAAFDCVDHIILIRRLNVSFGIDENALEWIVSYITCRRQYVRYNGRTSEISVVECSVPPQEARCSDRCTYFVLFTADVAGIADEHGFAIHGYADDMQIYDHCVVDDMHHPNPGLSTASVVSGYGWRTTYSSSTRQKPNSSGLVQLVAWPGVRSCRSWSTGPPFFHPRWSAT